MCFILQARGACAKPLTQGELVLGWVWSANIHDAEAWSSEIRDLYPRTGNKEFLTGRE